MERTCIVSEDDYPKYELGNFAHFIPSSVYSLIVKSKMADSVGM